MSTRVDCIVIRYNDLDLQQVAASLAGQQSISGGFHSVRTITVRCGGKRLSYMDLLNAARSAATGARADCTLAGSRVWAAATSRASFGNGTSTLSW